MVYRLNLSPHDRSDPKPNLHQPLAPSHLQVHMPRPHPRLTLPRPNPHLKRKSSALFVTSSPPTHHQIPTLKRSKSTLQVETNLASPYKIPVIMATTGQLGQAGQMSISNAYCIPHGRIARGHLDQTEMRRMRAWDVQTTSAAQA